MNWDDFLDWFIKIVAALILFAALVVACSGAHAFSQWLAS